MLSFKKKNSYVQIYFEVSHLALYGREIRLVMWCQTKTMISEALVKDLVKIRELFMSSKRGTDPQPSNDR